MSVEGSNNLNLSQLPDENATIQSKKPAKKATKGGKREDKSRQNPAIEAKKKEEGQLLTSQPLD